MELNNLTKAGFVTSHRRRRARHGAPGLRSPAHALRRPWLAREVLHAGMEHSPTSATGSAWERMP